MEKNKVQDSSIPDFKWTPDSKAEAVMADAVKYNLPVLIYFPDPWKKSPIKDIESAAFKRGMKGVALGLLVKTSKNPPKTDSAGREVRNRLISYSHSGESRREKDRLQNRRRIWK